jgi:hypothetical protein
MAMLSNTKESTEKRWAVCTVVPVILGCENSGAVNGSMF